MEEEAKRQRREGRDGGVGQVAFTSHEHAACDKTYKLTVMNALRGKASCVSVS